MVPLHPSTPPLRAPFHTCGEAPASIQQAQQPVLEQPGALLRGQLKDGGGVLQGAGQQRHGEAAVGAVGQLPEGGRGCSKRAGKRRGERRSAVVGWRGGRTSAHLYVKHIYTLARLLTGVGTQRRLLQLLPGHLLALQEESIGPGQGGHLQRSAQASQTHSTPAAAGGGVEAPRRAAHESAAALMRTPSSPSLSPPPLLPTPVPVPVPAFVPPAAPLLLLSAAAPSVTGPAVAVAVAAGRHSG